MGIIRPIGEDLGCFQERQIWVKAVSQSSQGLAEVSGGGGKGGTTDSSTPRRALWLTAVGLPALSRSMWAADSRVMRFTEESWHRLTRTHAAFTDPLTAATAASIKDCLCFTCWAVWQQNDWGEETDALLGTTESTLNLSNFIIQILFCELYSFSNYYVLSIYHILQYWARMDNRPMTGHSLQVWFHGSISYGKTPRPWSTKASTHTTTIMSDCFIMFLLFLFKDQGLIFTSR